MSAFPSSSAPACSLSAARTVPLPSIVFLMPSPCATSWNITFSKKASNVTFDSWSSTISSSAIGTQNAVELRAHRVLELQPARALLELHLFVVRQIDGDRLGAGVGLARDVDDVVRIQVGVGAGRLPLVARAARECRAAARAAARRSGASRLLHAGPSRARTTRWPPCSRTARPRMSRWGRARDRACCVFMSIHASRSADTCRFAARRAAASR